MTEKSSPIAGTTPGVTAGEARWTLALLTLIFGFNQLDRGIVAILLNSIKTEMELSDTMLGLMTGLGFSLVYAVACFPFGRLADRYSRVRIISFGVIFYSIMAAMMGFAQNVVQLIAARSAVAVGEATGNAPSSALIADLYPQETRTRALAIWSAGSYLGLFVGLTLGGWVHAHYGWRAALWVIGIPGIAIGLLTLFTAREPARGSSDRIAVVAGQETIKSTLAFLLSQRSYRWLFLGMMLGGVVAYSVQIWTPSILYRVHHMGAADVGFFSGLFKGLLGLLGILAGGYLTHAIAKGRLRLMALIPVISSLLVPPAMILFLLSDDRSISLAGLGVASFLIPAYQAPALTMVQAVSKPTMRALATTIILAAVTLGGLGIGPLVVGILSDAFLPAYGEESLRYALFFPALVPFLSAFCFWRASKHVAEEGERMLRSHRTAIA